MNRVLLASSLAAMFLASTTAGVHAAEGDDALVTAGTKPGVHMLQVGSYFATDTDEGKGPKKPLKAASPVAPAALTGGSAAVTVDPKPKKSAAPKSEPKKPSEADAKRKPRVTEEQPTDTEVEVPASIKRGVTPRIANVSVPAEPTPAAPPKQPSASQTFASWKPTLEQVKEREKGTGTITALLKRMNRGEDFDTEILSLVSAHYDLVEEAAARENVDDDVLNALLLTGPMPAAASPASPPAKAPVKRKAGAKRIPPAAAPTNVAVPVAAVAAPAKAVQRGVVPRKF